MITLKFIPCILLLNSILPTPASFAQQRSSDSRSVYLEDLSWTKAKAVLGPESVVVIPLGAEAKEHGPHLPLSSDYLQAMECARRVALERKVVIAPPINFGYYPVFIKYAGSTCLSFTTSVELVLQIVRSLAEYGPKRFYIINIGVSTTPTLELAAKILARSGILLYYSDYDRPDIVHSTEYISSMEFGGHADDTETGSILAIRPDLVNMALAVNDSTVKGKKGVWSPVPLEGATTNPTGIAGYAALGTREMGEKILSAFTKALVKEIDSIAVCPLPEVKENAEKYKTYEGEYRDSAGNSLIFTQNKNILYYVLNGRDRRNFFYLSEESEDYFTSIPFNVLFVKNSEGLVTKAWCQDNGKSFWVSKIK